MSADRKATPVIAAPESLSLNSASQLLSMGLGCGQRPVDELIAHLEGGATNDWLEKTLDDGPMKASGKARAMLLEGRASVEEIRAVKERSKRMLKAAKTAPERRAAQAGYFLPMLRHWLPLDLTSLPNRSRNYP